MKKSILILCATLLAACLLAGCNPPVTGQDPSTSSSPPTDVAGSLYSLVETHNFITASFDPEIILKSPKQIAAIDENGIDPYYCYNICAMEFEGEVAELGEPYLTAAERDAILSNEHGLPYYFFFCADEMQAGFDRIYGPDRVHVLSWPNQGYYFITESGYLATEGGWGDNGILWLYEKAESSIDGKYGIVTSYCIGYDYFTDTVIDSVSGAKLASGIPAAGIHTFSDAMAAAGLSRTELLPYDFVYFYESDHWYLHGLFPADSGYTLP